MKQKIIFKIIFAASLLLLGFYSTAQVAKAKKGSFAITNATIETVTNGTIQNGTLVIQNGKIRAIGTDVQIPAGATTIDATNKSIYPGMIDGGTTLGMSEVGSISLTQDYNEIGDVKPHMQALTAVNPNAVAIPVTRTNGITTVLVKPSGGVISGTASLINLVGYAPDQMFAGAKAMIVNYPASGRRGRFDRRSDEDRKKAEEKNLKKLNEIFEQARLYAKIDSAAQNNPSAKPEYNPEMQAMLPVVRGEMVVLIEVNREKDILAAIKWIEKQNINAVLTGVVEGWRVAEEIAKSGLPVITGPMQRTPTRSSDKYDRPYANAGAMHKAGVKVAIRTNDAENVRNLPFEAGFAAAYGMGKEAALKAVTIVPAEIFGVADQMGSLEVGKIANLFICTGDPFETKTKVTEVFIDGWQMSMDSRHIQLYNEFLERSPGLKK